LSKHYSKTNPDYFQIVAGTKNLQTQYRQDFQRTYLHNIKTVVINNINSPTLAKAYAMTNPHGLTKDNNLLFICDGKDGLKMYDAANPLAIVLKKQLPGIETYDAIAFNGNLLVVAKDGLYQYGYSYPATLDFKSKISTGK
jgi:hypothetical protein